MRTHRKSSSSANDTMHQAPPMPLPPHTACFLSLPSIEIVQFLELHAAVQLLNTCRTLRHDRVLTSSVLVRVPCAQHFFEGCAADWWHTTPLWKPSIYTSDLADDDDTLDNDWEDEQLLTGQVDDCHLTPEQQQQRQQHSRYTLSISLQPLFRSRFAITPSSIVRSAPPPATTPSTAAAARSSSSPWQRFVSSLPQSQHLPLLTLVSFVHERIFPQCFIPFKYASAIYTARPILIALPVDSSTLSLTQALATLDSSTGVTPPFVSPQAPPPSVFGVHWDTMTTATDSSRDCSACRIYSTTVSRYQTRVAALVAAWKAAVALEIPHWKASGMHQIAIDKRAYEMRHAMVPATGFYNSNIARRHGDVIVQHVCHSLAVGDSEDAAAEIATLAPIDPTLLTMALTADVQKQCTKHFGRLKAAMTAAFGLDEMSVERLRYTRGDRSAYANSWHDTLSVEIVASVANAGFVVGFLLIEKGD